MGIWGQSLSPSLRKTHSTQRRGGFRSAWIYENTILPSSRGWNQYGNSVSSPVVWVESKGPQRNLTPGTLLPQRCERAKRCAWPRKVVLEMSNTAQRLSVLSNLPLWNWDCSFLLNFGAPLPRTLVLGTSCTKCQLTKLSWGIQTSGLVEFADFQDSRNSISQQNRLSCSSPLPSPSSQCPHHRLQQLG